MEKGEPSSFRTAENKCDLCKSRGVSWICTGCKRVLCVDKDQNKEILERLQDAGEGPIICRCFSVLSNLSRDNVPAFYTDMGMINGKQVFRGMSFFQITHPKHFCPPCDTNEENEEGLNDQLLSVVTTSKAVATSSPVARTT